MYTKLIPLTYTPEDDAHFDLLTNYLQIMKAGRVQTELEALFRYGFHLRLICLDITPQILRYEMPSSVNSGLVCSETLALSQML